MYSTLMAVSLILCSVAFFLAAYKLIKEKRPPKTKKHTFNAEAYCNGLYREWYVSTTKGAKVAAPGESYEMMIWRLVDAEISKTHTEHPHFGEMKKYLNKRLGQRHDHR